MNPRGMSGFIKGKTHQSVDGSYRHKVTEFLKKPPEKLSNVSYEELPEKYKQTWFGKEYKKDSPIAFREVIAQEFFRLLAPNHPKTRWVEDKECDYLMSKGVLGIQKLSAIDPATILEKFKSGDYKGLGLIVVLAWLLNERDLKLDNIVLDENSSLVKLDGEQCFSVLDYPQNKHLYEMTEDDLRNLPFVHHYPPNHWFDSVVSGKWETSKTLDADIRENKQFLLDVNGSILRAILLPDSLIKTFTHSYAKNEAQREQAEILANVFIERRDNLRRIALENRSFLAYLQNRDSVDKYVGTYIMYLQDFSTTQKNQLKTKVPKLKEEVCKRLEELLVEIKPKKLQKSASYLASGSGKIGSPLLGGMYSRSSSPASGKQFSPVVRQNILGRSLVK